MKQFDDLVGLVLGLTADVAKAEAGNASAGTRVRKGMQEVKVLAQGIREEILSIKAEGGK